MDIITVSYSVSSANQQRFRQFIDDVRSRLRVKERPFVMQHAARLPLQENVPRRWLDLELRDGGDDVVTLRIRADNLYLTGFRGGNGKWFELQPDNGGQPLIQGSSPLAFNGSYAGSDGIGTIEDEVDHSTMANIAASYNVSSRDQQRFRQFIDDVRSRLRVAERPFVMQHAARLPLQEDLPRRWLDLELRDGDDSVVTLRIRADNLYLTGFRGAGGNGKWFELQRDNGGPPLIQGSSPLAFNGSYAGNAGIGTIEDQLPRRQGEAPRPNVRLGRPSVRDAIEGLANYHQTRSDDVREWLRTLVVNFIESIRFNSIADRVAVQMANPSPDRDSDGVRLSLEMMNLIKNWRSLSDALLYDANDTGQDPHVRAARFRNFSAAGIHNAFEAAAALGMVLVGGGSPSYLNPRQP